MVEDAAVTDFRTLPAGRDLDAIVAERVMGFRWYVSSSSGNRGIFEPDRRPSWFTKPANGDEPLATDHDWQVPKYSTDVAAAFAVVDAAVLTCRILLDGRATVEFVEAALPEPRSWRATGETVALAISRAALAWAEARDAENKTSVSVRKTT